MFFIGQNLKHVHMTYSFLELFDLLLINSSRDLVFRVYSSPNQRNIVCEYKLHGKTIMTQKQTFSSASDIDVEKTCFLM